MRHRYILRPKPCQSHARPGLRRRTCPPTVLLAGLLCAVLSGCAGTLAPVTAPDPQGDVAGMPAMREFGSPRPIPPARANADMAIDFIDLTMELESGAPLPVFTRFDEPVTVALAGAATPVFDTELDRLVTRLRREAGIDIRRTDAAGAITVEAVRRADLDRVVPQAACFVLPLATSWTVFQADTRAAGLNWADLTSRQAATIFIPADISAQEIRDCLHEEIAQALGPVNDLFRLEDSIFNDDNMHSVLTGFDMLMLRVAYDPALANGMARETVAARLPAILARLNPAGESVPARGIAPTPPEWQRATVFALSPNQPVLRRRQASLRALSVAQDEGWQDVRLGLSLLTAGRLSTGRDAGFALEAFFKAGQVYGARPATAVHAAQVGIQVAAFALVAEDFDTVLRLTDRHIPAARRAENGALLGDLLMVRAAALDALGRSEVAAEIRGDGFGWARYGLRSDAEVLRRAAEIAALLPPEQEGS
ncbi:DUF2927 domain-containing protein [Meridianimarinicoccus sp. RP-17]|uniref:DUF2927 domain-containing protein n=1 Tax=Meridianimarinicoccus zhengii TaxID=2056810 RepID=UPI001F38C5D5|nr:DUF2927 domain-containing protein [Phycocomes zhengii]